MTAPELTAAERIRVYAAAGGLNLSPETLNLVADAIEESEATLKLASETYGKARKFYRTAIHWSVVSLVSGAVWMALIIWTGAGQ